jgi:hypothetical protein
MNRVEAVGNIYIYIYIEYLAWKAPTWETENWMMVINGYCGGCKLD